MNENTKLLLFLALVTFLSFVFGQTYRQLRSFRLKMLAKKYKLVYSKKFHFFYPNIKFNVIEGNLNGNKINIYDSVSRKSYGASVGSGISAYQTIIQIGDDQIRTKPKHFTKIKYIEDEIKKCL